MADKVRIFALGGLDEEGKNLTVIEINQDIFVLEAGIKEPDKTMPGIDYVIPRYDYLKENKDRVKAYLLSHGHDDEIGALAYIYQDVPAPIYGSEVTLNMLKTFTKHVGKDPSIYKMFPVPATSSFKVAGRKIEFFHTAHNIASSSGIAISTDMGNIVYTGDYVVENSASPSYLHDMSAIGRIAETPTLALLSESIYASKPGYTAPLYKLAPHVSEAFKNAQGRIFISLFSLNFFNFDEIISLSVSCHKKIICYDKATEALLDTLQTHASKPIPRENRASMDEILRLRDIDIVVLISGYGAKLFRKIALLAAKENEDKRFAIKESDTFIVASPSDDNSEIEYSDAVDELYRTNCHVINVPKKSFLRMHASEEDIKMMVSVFKPKYYIPVKGFYKDLLRNGMIALSMGINLSHQNVFLLENGMSVLIDENGGRMFDEKIPHGDLLIDGEGVGDVSAEVLEDRSKLGDGLIVMAMTVSRANKKVLFGPDIQMKGFLLGKEAENITKELSKIFVATVEEFLPKMDFNVNEVRQNCYQNCLRFIRRVTGKEPMILPIIVEA